MQFSKQSWKLAKNGLQWIPNFWYRESKRPFTCTQPSVCTWRVLTVQLKTWKKGCVSMDKVKLLIQWIQHKIFFFLSQFSFCFVAVVLVLVLVLGVVVVCWVLITLNEWKYWSGARSPDFFLFSLVKRVLRLLYHIFSSSTSTPITPACYCHSNAFFFVSL